MRRSAAILVLHVALGLQAQNLVPNPSFEELTACPTFASQLDLAAPWYNPTLGTPELYNGCADYGSYVSVPHNATGGNQSARTGVGYAGLYTWRTDVANMREYAEVPLIAPLVAGRCYRVKMYVNMPDDHPYACDGFGARLSVGPITANNATVLPFAPQVQHPSGVLITDTAAWTEVSGVYTAVGGETHLTIGNFKNDAATQAQLIHPGVWYSTSAYLLVDDVSVEAIDLSVDLGPDTLICSGSHLLLDATTTGATYQWEDGSTAPTLLADPGEHWVRVSLGACSSSDTIIIRGGGAPEVHLSDAAICPGTSVVLDVSGPGAHASWSDGDTSLVRIVDRPGTYTVHVENECGGLTEEAVISEDICPCVPFLPNAFTPNHDGLNDEVGPEFHCGEGRVTWSLFDRWGTELFSAEEATARWNGTVNGTDLPEGIYAWRATVFLQHAVDVRYSGHVLLLR